MTTKDKVIEILTEQPHTRDSDPALFQAVIGLTHCIHAHSYYEITELQQKKLIPSHESMRRCRQKVQEHNPYLRGKCHDERQELAEIVTPLVNTDFTQASMLF